MAIGRFDTGWGMEQAGGEPMRALKLKGTSGNDGFDLSLAGDYHVQGRGGDDFVITGDEFTARDRFNGGAGYDVLDLNGSTYAFGLTFGTHSLQNVEEIRLGTSSYSLTLDNANVAPGGMLFVNGINAQSTVIDGSAVEGDLVIHGGYVRGLLNGGAGDDKLYAGGDGTVMYGHGGDDQFIFTYQPNGHVLVSFETEDFAHGDIIDLSALDADTGTPGNQAFHFGATPGHAGDLTVAYDATNLVTMVTLFTNGDPTPDMRIYVPGNFLDLAPADLVL